MTVDLSNSKKQMIWTFLVAIGVALVALQQAGHSGPNRLSHRPAPDALVSSRPLPMPMPIEATEAQRDLASTPEP